MKILFRRRHLCAYLYLVHSFRYFDFDKLQEVTHIITENLNKIIDVNFYPAETARRSNMRHRPIGIGVQVRVRATEFALAQERELTTCVLKAVLPWPLPSQQMHCFEFCVNMPMSEQGLADTFILLGLPFDSAEAKQLNKEIFETIYFAALEKSCSLAKMDGVHC